MNLKGMIIYIQNERNMIKLIEYKITELKCGIMLISGQPR